MVQGMVTQSKQQRWDWPCLAMPLDSSVGIKVTELNPGPECVHVWAAKPKTCSVPRDACLALRTLTS